MARNRQVNRDKVRPARVSEKNQYGHTDLVPFDVLVRRPSERKRLLKHLRKKNKSVSSAERWETYE
jgi:hypothetical protein